MDELLERLEGMNRQELKAFWTKRFGGEALNSRATDLLRRRIAWRLQEERIGGLSGQMKRRLRELARGFEKDSAHKPIARRSVQTGTVLSREWKGRVHTVQVRNDGFIYNGNHYKGLSKIAREITGTRWSGPLFFGLRKPARKAKGAS
jgi:Protein of unknown function (DUF2924)